MSRIAIWMSLDLNVSSCLSMAYGMAGGKKLSKGGLARSGRGHGWRFFPSSIDTMDSTVISAHVI